MQVMQLRTYSNLATRFLKCRGSIGILTVVSKNGLLNNYTTYCASLHRSCGRNFTTFNNQIISESRVYTFAVLRRSSSSHVDIPVVQYEDVKKLSKKSEKLLIDVREPHELEETGRIPRSINIPLGNVSQELSPCADAEEFKKKYGLPKPDNTTELIFSCKSGKRSQDAAMAAVALGYKRVNNYAGSWNDWAEREGLKK